MNHIPDTTTRTAYVPGLTSQGSSLANAATAITSQLNNTSWLTQYAGAWQGVPNSVQPSGNGVAINLDIYIASGSGEAVDVGWYDINNSASLCVRLSTKSGDVMGQVGTCPYNGTWNMAAGTAVVAANSVNLPAGWYNLRAEYNLAGGIVHIYVNGILCSKLVGWYGKGTSSGTRICYEVGTGNLYAPTGFLGKTQDHLTDGTTYARTLASGLTSGGVNFGAPVHSGLLPYANQPAQITNVIGSSASLIGLDNISDGSTYYHVGNVNSSHQAQAATLAAGSVHIRKSSTFTAQSVTGSVSTVCTINMGVGTASGDLVFFGWNLSGLNISGSQNFFIAAAVNWAGAGGTCLSYVDYAYQDVFGCILLVASASSSTSATLNLYVEGTTGTGTCGGVFYVGNQQAR